MAENVQTLVSTGATLPVGTGVVFDGVTIGGTTGNVEYVKLMSGSSGSTVTIPASSAAIGAIGLNVSVTNSTVNPIGVSLVSGQSSVSVAGNVNVTFSTASTASVIIAGGNSTVVFTTASKGQMELSTTLMGGSTANPVYVVNKPFALFANSTWACLKITSTVNSTIFSSAASTRFNMTDLVMTNAGTVECVATIYDGSTTGTKLFWTDLASGGGGVSIQFSAPRRTTSGLALIIETVPASSVYVNVGAFRSS